MSLSQPHPAEEPSLLHFAQHLSYPLREQWISKGLLALANAERRGTLASVFAYPTATDHLGIGPAMVLSLRFWLRATGVMIERRERGARRLPALTPWGRLLVQADPYLEQPGSLWLLHAHLARNQREAPVFAWFFQQFASPRLFTKEACVQACLNWAIKESPTQIIRQKSVQKEIECLLRTYLPTPLLSPEEQLGASPLQHLRFLMVAQPVDQADTSYRFRAPLREEVPALVVLAILLEQAGKHVLLREVLSQPMQVGRTFGITQDVLFEHFASLRAFLPAWCPTVTHMGRLDWLTIPNVPVEQALQSYYGLC